MRIYKRPGSKFYSYEFWVNKIRIQKTSKLTNRQAAMDEMTRHRTCLVKGEVFVPGWKQVSPSSSASAPESEIETLSQFEDVFLKWVRSETDNPRTVKFYATCYKRLCTVMGKLRLDEIDEPQIEVLKLRLLEDMTRTTTNRHLACLRKCLRYAALSLRKFDRVPRIKLYPNEPGREFVFDDDTYRSWLEIAPEPLYSASVLARESGICRNEMLQLRKDAVDLHDYGDQDDIWGTISVIRGLKRRARKRTLPITRAMADVLRKQIALSECEHVFSSLRDRKQPLTGDTLGIQHTRTMKAGEFHPGSGLHALRHTFLTEAARVTPNVRVLMKIAGHSQVATTMRYIHPEERDIVAVSATLQRDRQRREQEHAAAPVPVPEQAESLQKRLQ